jgi:hypothetical protein
MPVTIKDEETISMIRNATIPFIEEEDGKDENTHIFEIMNVEWILENSILRKIRILEVVKMAANYLWGEIIPFQFDINTRILEHAILMKIKCVN